jgi:stage III sporulation protein SpoIIIAA
MAKKQNGRPAKKLASGEADPTDDLDALLRLLPPTLQSKARAVSPDELLEVVLDLGRPPQARLVNGVEDLSKQQLSRDELEHIVSLIGAFTADNRAGLERTLHRISAIRNRQGDIVGLTLRVGRAIQGTIDVLRDLIESGVNVLLLGRPGVGKTTKLREVARVLADDFRRRVMVIDTSNEIGGDGDIPHPAIGSARRMQVPHPDRQHAVMIEAVENHMPEVIIVDEIGTEAEAMAARTIAERGVQLIGTAHGNTLENLILNPTLSDLIGGVQTVTLSDEEAHRRGTQKTVRERRAPPTFDVIVEILSREEVLVHRSTAEAVDKLLAGIEVKGERRKVGASGAVETEEVEAAPLPMARQTTGRTRTPRLYAYGLSPSLMERVIRELHIHARVVDRPTGADMIIALKSRAGDPRVRRIAESGVPVHLVKHATSAQLRRLLQNLFMLAPNVDEDEVRDAVQEAEHAIHRVLGEGIPIELAPRQPTLRKMQHRLVTRYHLVAESIGSEPTRHLVIHPQ